MALTASESDRRRRRQLNINEKCRKMALTEIIGVGSTPLFQEKRDLGRIGLVGVCFIFFIVNKPPRREHNNCVRSIGFVVFKKAFIFPALRLMPAAEMV